MEWSIKLYNFEFLFLQIQSCSKFLNLYFVIDVNAFSEKPKVQISVSSVLWYIRNSLDGNSKKYFFIACIGFEMKFLGRLGIICHVTYYYKGNVYTTSCKKKSKPVITRGKIKLFRSQNVMFQRNLSRIRREIIWNRKKKNCTRCCSYTLWRKISSWTLLKFLSKILSGETLCKLVQIFPPKVLVYTRKVFLDTF